MLSLPAFAMQAELMAFIDGQIAAHPGQSGVYVLERGEDALQARAWLADNARQSIEVQYFIWSTDNIGTLAAEALLRAAERGVKVRVIVDDLLIDAPDKTLLALALHPDIDIRIYNPQHNAGTPLHKRLLNVALDFRGVNQRMHDKTFIVDGKLTITGGRNMADEYFDYDHEYNFRDRDALLLGEAVKTMRASFENFWTSKLSVPVEELYDGLGLMQKNVRIDSAAVRQVYRDLHDYAKSPENYSPLVRALIEATPESFPELAQKVVWGEVEFIHDRPGKNDNHFRLDGGGQTTQALAKLAESARERIVIQSPYLVLSNDAVELFEKLIARGVKVRVCTNSLASTDNVQAFSGYRNQRDRLLEMGMEIFEYRPDPAVQTSLMPRAKANAKPPVFAIHAKSMVVDGELAFIGTYNLDPRSENLNTEVGVVIRDAALARMVEEAIETDMQPATAGTRPGTSRTSTVPWPSAAGSGFGSWPPSSRCCERKTNNRGQTTFQTVRQPMTHTYCMTSNCALAETCARYEDDAGKHLLTRTYADFSEELVRRPDNTATCPFFIDKNDAQQTAH